MNDNFAEIENRLNLLLPRVAFEDLANICHSYYYESESAHFWNKEHINSYSSICNIINTNIFPLTKDNNYVISSNSFSVITECIKFYYVHFKMIIAEGCLTKEHLEQLLNTAFLFKSIAGKPAVAIDYFYLSMCYDMVVEMTHHTMLNKGCIFPDITQAIIDSLRLFCNPYLYMKCYQSSKDSDLLIDITENYINTLYPEWDDSINRHDGMANCPLFSAIDFIELYKDIDNDLLNAQIESGAMCVPEYIDNIFMLSHIVTCHRALEILHSITMFSDLGNSKPIIQSRFHSAFTSDKYVLDFRSRQLTLSHDQAIMHIIPYSERFINYKWNMPEHVVYAGSSHNKCP